jgi:hypothetical protein
VIALGHIAGVPVEETLLSMLPAGAVGLGVAACAARGRLRSLRRRRRFGARRVAGQARRSGIASR